jgi:exodeoxyribonuclease VII small subunit
MSKSDKTIQQKMTELNEMVQWFQSEDFVLEEAVEKFKKADELAKEIDADLSALKNEITVLSQRFDTE